MCVIILGPIVHFSDGPCGTDRETDFYTPPVLGGAAFFDNTAPAVYKIQGP